jgi:ketosteroid isomerase-like protein
MSQENVKIVATDYEAFGRGDVATVLASLDPQVIWNEAENLAYADGNPYIGPDAVLKGVFARIGAEWDGFIVVPTEILDSGDTVVMHGRYRGTYKATGASINAQVAHVFKFRNGKIVSFQQYADTAQIRDAMGKRASA